MTDEELDEARAREAVKTNEWLEWETLGPGVVHALIAVGRLAREGWVPVDPDLVEARHIAAMNTTGPAMANYAGGFYDDHDHVRIALAAIKRGRELERGS